MEEIGRIRKKIREEAHNIEVDESDIPIHEKFVKEGHIKELRKNKKKTI